MTERIESDLARAKGLGSAHEGLHHWMNQKITAIANIPLVGWFVYSMVSLIGASYEEFTSWLALPWNAVLFILLIISTFYHANLGAQVIVEDYISNKAFRTFKLISNKIFMFALAILSIFCVLKIAFAG